MSKGNLQNKTARVFQVTVTAVGGVMTLTYCLDSSFKAQSIVELFPD